MRIATVNPYYLYYLLRLLSLIVSSSRNHSYP